MKLQEPISTRDAFIATTVTGVVLGLMGHDPGLVVGFWLGVAYAWSGEGRGVRLSLCALWLALVCTETKAAAWHAALWWAAR